MGGATWTMEEKGSMTRMLLVMDFTSCKMIPMECVKPAVAEGDGEVGVGARDLSPSPGLHLLVTSVIHPNMTIL